MQVYQSNASVHSARARWIDLLRIGILSLVVGWLSLVVVAPAAWGWQFDLPSTNGSGQTNAGQWLEAWSGQSHIVSSNTGSNIFDGMDVNVFLGANRFYDAGLTGTTAIQANIESGHVWNGHATLTHVTTRVTGSGALGTDRTHATSVGHAMGGRFSGQFPGNRVEYGIAPDATLWSGAIATAFGSGGSFSTTNSSVATTYSTILVSGVNGQTADVYNSSWGFSNPTGTNLRTRGVDGLLNMSGAVGVQSAGNRGPDPNTVGGIGSGYNSITVAALGSDTSNPPYNNPSGFSSRGPNDFALATGPTSWQLIEGVRAAVDIAAPGQNLTLAVIGDGSSPNFYSGNRSGTSFSAPLVAGGAALVVDAGRQLNPGNVNATDGRVVKAVLLNAADKTNNWDNGQTLVGNVVTTTQSLDWAVGAGRMNLDRTFDQYVHVDDDGMATTTDLPGLDGGDVGAIGWDFGFVEQDSSNFYFIDTALVGGTTFTSTLTWFADRTPGNLDNFSGAAEEHLADLDLRIFEFDNLDDRNILGTVAESISLYNVVEHLSFELPNTGFFGIEVEHAGTHWNFTGETGEFFGLAWFGTAVPEPSSLILALVALAIAGPIRRRRRD